MYVYKYIISIENSGRNKDFIYVFRTVMFSDFKDWLFFFLLYIFLLKLDTYNKQCKYLINGNNNCCLVQLCNNWET